MDWKDILYIQYLILTIVICLGHLDICKAVDNVDIVREAS
jgi:hypothetical protein